MANYFIFGIGGSGSRVIRSLTMLLAAGFKPFKASDTIVPILIDYDIDNADTKRTTELLDLYHSIHEATYSQKPSLPNNNGAESNDKEFFSTPIEKMIKNNPSSAAGFAMNFKADNKQTFEQWIGYKQLTGDKIHTADLLNSLYDTSSDDETAELYLDMTVGFKGNPNIGSVVFNSLQKTPEFGSFVSRCEKGDRVLIIGSLFGGTGSSGIPELVKAIRGSQNSNVNNVPLSVVMVCPYFGFNTSDEKAVRGSIFNSKTKAALNYYKRSNINEKIDSIYYVGDDCTSSYKYSEGGVTQCNNIHIVDLVCALSICHFANRKFAEKDLNPQRNTKQYKYRIAEVDDPENSENMDDDASQKASSKLNFTNFCDSQLEEVILPLASFALALRFFHDEVALKSSAVEELDWYTSLELASCFSDGKVLTPSEADQYKRELLTCCKGLLDFYDAFTQWNEEFKAHTAHSLNLFDFKKENSLCDFIIDGGLKVESKSFIGLKTAENLLKMEGDVAECTKNAWTKIKLSNDKANNKDILKFKSFLLMQVLAKGCSEVFECPQNNKRTAKRIEELASHTIKI